MVAAGLPVADLPPQPPLDLHPEEEEAVGLVLGESIHEERRYRDAIAAQVRGPRVDVLVPLVEGRDGGCQRDLLVVVGGVDVQALVVDAHPVVRISRRQGHLEIGGEEIGGGEVEGEDGGIMERELGL